MAYWLALAVVTLAATAAAIVTAMAWRRRKTTPRTLSLALSWAACVAMLVTAADASFAVPRALCEERLAAGAENAAPLEERLRAALDRWTWMLRPCGRVEVTVEPRDLVAPIALGDLVELAVRARVAVDVKLAEGVLPTTEEIRLARAADEDVEEWFSATTPIPRSYTDKIYPKLPGAQGSMQCQIDDEPVASDPRLDLLIDHQDEETEREKVRFHRLRCWPSERPDEAVTAYVQIVTAGVVFASSDEAFVKEIEAGEAGSGACSQSPADCLGIRTGLTKSAGLEVASVVMETDALTKDASMLVLDRPRRPESCEVAEMLLRRGATVVVAQPEGEFFSNCKLPIQRMPEAQDVIFDRTPRLTFMFDEEFEKGLDKSPTAVIGCAEPNVSRRLEPSIEAQKTLAAEICRETQFIRGPMGTGDCLPSDKAAARVRHLGRDTTRQVSCPDSADCKRIEHSSPRFAVSEYMRERKARSDVWENEHLVIFTHDPREDPPLRSIKSLPISIHMIGIEDPYGSSLSTAWKDHPGEMDPPGWPDVVADPSMRLSSEITLDARPHPPQECSFTRRMPALFDIQASQSRGASHLSLAAQTRAAWQRTSEVFSRFPHPRTASDEVPTEAPIRFNWWQQPPTRALRVRDMAVELAATTTDGGLVQRTLAVGAMVGRGHLLLMSYSPFEDESSGESWRAGVSTRKHVLGGMDLIEDLYKNTEAFIAEVHGKIVGVKQQTDGALWITVTRDAVGAQGLHSLKVHTKQIGSIDAPLVDFSSERGLYTYALPAVELEKFAECEPLRPLGTDEAVVVACPPVKVEGTSSRMAAVQALEQLARYSGGRLLLAGAADIQPRVRTRTLGLGLLACVFWVAWGRRAIRRMRGRAAERRLRQAEQIVQRRYDPPEAVVAAGGDWDGRATTWPRTGAFGGYRPIEPGDRAGAAVLSDLLVRQLQGTQVLPRVALRIEEAAPTTAILLNLGASMRMPGSGERSKGRCAGQIGMHIAASAWRIGGEVAMSAVGIAGETEIVPPQRLSPGHEEAEQSLLLRLRQPPVRDATPWPAELPESGAVVYVSDFQHEDERALQAWLASLEGAGIRVGGVMIYSPDEFTMIEGGRLAGSGVWVDRADWDPDDVFAAFCRRRDQIERIFEMTTGGLAVIATTFHSHDVEQALADGRLLQVLR
ncbi:hypothetical protein OV203_19410 [Nannocystis sp. ILAH1]|uniref:hypothetical protein n=1 Tax=Nannocystis sp. ILAH1 TaxID=2996789 RepID=UPI0022712BCA|nr:hypothetical protein [Nannocystis sp. ILAH1]MCY0989316.1 hypothetical protein [Nannocystis sp. ILAH1]